MRQCIDIPCSFRNNWENVGKHEITVSDLDFFFFAVVIQFEKIRETLNFPRKLVLTI